MIAQHNNTRFGTMRLAISVRLDCQYTHGWNGFWDLTRTLESKILLLRDTLVDIQIFQSILFFIVGVKPYMPVRIQGVEGLNKGRWAR